jgi:hypothetical protein
MNRTLPSLIGALVIWPAASAYAQAAEVSQPLPEKLRMDSLKPEIKKADGIVFDIRALTRGTQPGIMTAMFEPIGSSLVSREVVGPAERSLLHSGYRPQVGWNDLYRQPNDGGYRRRHDLDCPGRDRHLV